MTNNQKLLHLRIYIIIARGKSQDSYHQASDLYEISGAIEITVFVEIEYNN